MIKSPRYAFIACLLAKSKAGHFYLQPRRIFERLYRLQLLLMALQKPKFVLGLLRTALSVVRCQYTCVDWCSII
jgi:hypothetical protein